MSKLIKGAGGGGGGGCFQKGTQVQLQHGKTIAIEDLQIGDEVIAFDEEGNLHPAKVTKVHVHDDPQPILRVKFWNGHVNITANHWVLNQYGSFVEIGSMSEEDAIVDGMGHLRPILGAELIGHEPVWNLTVEPHHTFIANGVRVHNGGHRSKHPVIAGAGGGGGGGKGGGGGSARVAVESPDSLRSKAFAKVIDLICEGEIVGLVDGAKSIYLNETPIQNSDGTYNFEGVEVTSRNGTQFQDYIPGFSAVESENYVGVEFKNSLPVTRRITNAETNAARVTISIPQLTYQDMKTGDISGSSVDIEIQLQSNGGGFNTVRYDTITGKTTSKYERSYRIDLTGDAPWDIRVVRTSADSTQAALQNKTFWEGYTEIIDAKLRYPNSALVGIKVDSSQFNSIPVRAYDMKLTKVKVPSNYNPETRTYTGIWNGTFTVAWTDNPAWCFYDLLTNDRYGLGGLIDENQVDKWALYSVARYCDELVPDGFGSTEPRFTCNMYIQSRADAYKVMQDMASIFRGMIYWQSGALTVSQDAPSDPVYLYTPANVLDGVFNYQGSSAKTRHTVALIGWNDPEDFYRQKIEYVEDAAGIARYGIVETSATAIGCTSRGQANRVGRWLLYSEQSESEIVAFKTGIEGATCRPGQVIAVSDPVRGGTRRGGRVVSATTSQITVDGDFTLPDTGHTMSVVLSSGMVEQRSVTGFVGRTVTLSSALSAAPDVGAIWVLESPNLQTQLFRVVSVNEAEDGIEINALAHNPDKYDAIENDLILQPRQISSLSVTPNAPQNIVISESLYESSAEIKTVITVSWDSVQGGTSYAVKYKRDDGNFVNLPETTAASVDIFDAVAGRYTFNIAAVNAVGKKSATSTKTQTILGRSAPPSDVQNFSLIPIGGMAYLSWDKATDLDVLVGGTVRVRWTPKTTGQDWNEAIDILSGMSGNQQNAQAPLLAGTYLARFVDSSGNPSLNTAQIVTNAATVNGFNVIDTLTEDPSFAGTKTDVEYNSSVTGIILSDDGSGNILPEGTYYFDNDIDLGAVYTSRLSAYMEAAGFTFADLIDSRLGNVDDWLDFDGDRIDDVNATLYLRSTDDNPAGVSPTWTEWKPFFVGEYTARAYQFKVVLTSANYDHNIVVQALNVTIDMPDRVVDIRNISSGTGTYSVTYSEPFKAAPTIGVTANNMASGDYYTISSQTNTGFDIIFKNAAGTTVSRTFSVLAKGYGRAV